MSAARFVFDFHTLEDHAEALELAKKLSLGQGHEIHILVPNATVDEETYAMNLVSMGLKFAKIHLTPHLPLMLGKAQSSNRRDEISAWLTDTKPLAFWSQFAPDVETARGMSISACHVGHNPVNITTRIFSEHLTWGLEVAK